MNPIQTTGKAAAGIVDALKGQPLVLALIVIAFALVGLLYYQSAMFNTQTARERQTICRDAGGGAEIAVAVHRAAATKQAAEHSAVAADR